MQILAALFAGWVMLCLLAHPLQTIIGFTFLYMLIGIYQAYDRSRDRKIPPE